MFWIIDNRINLTETAVLAQWHHGTTVAKLVDAGIGLKDAESFTRFVFADGATVRDCQPEEYVSDEQYERLTVIGEAQWKRLAAAVK